MSRMQAIYLLPAGFEPERALLDLLRFSGHGAQFQRAHCSDAFQSLPAVTTILHRRLAAAGFSRMVESFRSRHHFTVSLALVAL